MPYRPAPLVALLLCLSTLFSSCLVRRRVITRKGGGATQPLLTADKATLIDRIARLYAGVHDFSATVDMTPALGSAEKSRITEYKDVRGYILFRKPADIRIIGLYPVVRNKAFEMVSNGADFRLYVPARERFIVGRNQLTAPSANKLENLRPQHFVDALLVRPPQEGEQAVLENLTDEDSADYILHLVEPGSGALRLSRSIWFERYTLTLARQLEYDPSGNIISDTRYGEWQAWDGVPFPKHVEINRPRDEYAVVLNVVKMDVNKGLSDDKFVLEQPAGTTMQVVGEKPASVSSTPSPTPPAKGKK